MSLTEAIALDCEMVGAGHRGSISIVARVSIVNEFYQCIYNTYVLPRLPVTDYRTFVSGIEPHHLKRGIPFEQAKRDVCVRLKGRILVGHSVDKDLKVLGLCHPDCNTRDTALYPRFQTPRGTPSLKNLAARFTNMKIQDGAHCSIRDARATMMVYKRFEQVILKVLLGRMNMTPGSKDVCAKCSVELDNVDREEVLQYLVMIGDDKAEQLEEEQTRRAPRGGRGTQQVPSESGSRWHVHSPE